jgi:Fe(3+) dicitrate transport protein
MRFLVLTVFLILSFTSFSALSQEYLDSSNVKTGEGSVSDESSPHASAHIPAKKILINGQTEDFVTNTVVPQRLSKEKMELYKYTDVNRALKQTTGVYVREEDGYGLRPNIGLRGTNPDRSKKIVFLEDGVLIGPAPYSAPAAYYSPSMNHTETLDVYKGFTAVPFGPNSIGGTVNYLTTSIPGASTHKMEASTGMFNTQNIKLVSGSSGKNTGYVVNASHLKTDGFKVLDGGGNTGFVKNDIMAKFRFDLSPAQNLEFKGGYSDEDSNETYLGLAGKDLEKSPYRRYASSALDNMRWIHTTAQINHSWLVSENTSVLTQLYRHDFDRTWKRMDRFVDSQAPSLFEILLQPEQNAQFYNILSGAEDSTSTNGLGDLIQASNQRTYYSQGAQTKINTNFTIADSKHDFEVGLRFHQDQIRRNHTNRQYQMVGGQLISATNQVGQDAMNSMKATALTLNFVENIAWNQWVFTGLARLERVNYKFQNTLNRSIIERDNDVFAPGAAVLYNLHPRSSLKVSANRGVSVAGLNDDGSEAQERSINYEVGYKYTSESGKSVAEVIGFYNDYSNITGTCTASTGCTNAQVDVQYNGGQAVIRGIEARVAHSLNIGVVEVPLQINATFLNAEFRNDFVSGSAEWGKGQVLSGDPLPYVPQVQYTFTVGANYKKITQEMAFIYQGPSMDQSVALSRQEIAGYGIVDWTGRYAVNKKTNIFARLDNLLGKDYTVSLRPFGARPGKPQSFMVGLSHQF